MNVSQFLAIILLSLTKMFKVQEKFCVEGVIGFGFDSHCRLKTGVRFLKQSQSVAITIIIVVLFLTVI